MRDYAIVGCGGIGAWLGMLLSKQIEQGSRLILFDGDIVEEHNLDRQLFSTDDIGRNKAECLGEKLHCETKVMKRFFRHDSMEEFSGVLFVGADNHPARRCALECSDMVTCDVIIAANEYTDAEAYYYKPAWRSTNKDPRNYYPEIQTDNSDDPTMPCTGEAQVRHPQLAIANSMAASYAMWLYWFWKVKSPDLDSDMQGCFPVLTRSNFSRISVKTVSEFDE